MKFLPRTQFGNPILRGKARRINLRLVENRPFQKLIQNMFFTMHRANGVGLAAPQINWPIQLAVVEIRKSRKRPLAKFFPPTVIINPQITKQSKQMLNDWEGCLSCTGLWGLVPRHKTITVGYYDEFGKKKILNLEGLTARVFQHEIDHLNGIVYLDRMKNTKNLMTDSEFKKRVLKNKGLKSR